VPKALQFLEGLEDPISADLQFPQKRVGGVNGQGSVVVCQWAQRFRRQVGGRSAGRLEASQ